MSDFTRRYAEKANYFQTTVAPAISQGEIAAMLEDFGATAVVTMAGTSVSQEYVWVIRFQWGGRSYRFSFSPLVCENPDKIYTFGGKKRTAVEQSRYQMGRIAFGFVKAILTAAEATPDALFGFMELPRAKHGGDLPPTTAQLGAEELAGTLQLPSGQERIIMLGGGE